MDPPRTSLLRRATPLYHALYCAASRHLRASGTCVELVLASTCARARLRAPARGVAPRRTIRLSPAWSPTRRTAAPASGRAHPALSVSLLSNAIRNPIRGTWQGERAAMRGPTRGVRSAKTRAPRLRPGRAGAAVRRESALPSVSDRTGHRTARAHVWKYTELRLEERAHGVFCASASLVRAYMQYARQNT